MSTALDVTARAFYASLCVPLTSWRDAGLQAPLSSPLPPSPLSSGSPSASTSASASAGAKSAAVGASAASPQSGGRMGWLNSLLTFGADEGSQGEGEGQGSSDDDDDEDDDNAVPRGGNKAKSSSAGFGGGSGSGELSLQLLHVPVVQAGTDGGGLAPGWAPFPLPASVLPALMAAVVGGLSHVLVASPPTGQGWDEARLQRAALASQLRHKIK
jgi:hypothetical protein